MVKYEHIQTKECKNNLSSRLQKSTVSELIEMKLSNGFIYGPFDTLPFTNYRVSPLGVVEKYSSKKRLILD